MESHGDYKINLTGNVIHIYPSGSFNQEGVKQLNDKVLLIAPQNSPWALLAHADESAGLTPEAVNEIINFFQQISKENCVVIGIAALPTWQGVLEKSIKENADITIPVYLDANLSKLDSLIKKIMDSA
tara:strand:- start:11223 stop:11606 length:384 start_codon:yes stop_codon:yes gene_type:complete